MNPIARNLTIQSYHAFLNSFNEARNVFWDDQEGRLRHAGEFGVYREDLVRSWLRVVVPERFGISSGFIITSVGSISTQCDIIIYDRTTTPRIENSDRQRFFPIETVCCIGEVKSDVGSIGELNGHLKKLAATKALRSEVHAPDRYAGIMTPGLPYDPDRSSWDNVFSFLICNRFKFTLDIDGIDYGDVPKRFRHNDVLSLEDGLLNYSIGKKGNLCTPFSAVTHRNCFMPTDGKDLPRHVRGFLLDIHVAVQMTTLLNIDLVRYLSDEVQEDLGFLYEALAEEKAGRK